MSTLNPSDADTASATPTDTPPIPNSHHPHTPVAGAVHPAPTPTPRLHSTSPAKSLTPSSPRPPAKLSPPPPIPIPHLLLHRSRLKPVPKPHPAPLQPPPAFNHLFPLRSKLRSTTAPIGAPPTPDEPLAAPLPSRSVSASRIPPQAPNSPTSTLPTTIPPITHALSAASVLSLNPEQPIDPPADLISTASDTPNPIPHTGLVSHPPVPSGQHHGRTTPTRAETHPAPPDQIDQHPDRNILILAETRSGPVDQIAPEISLQHSDNLSHLSPTMADPLDHSTPSLSSKSTSPDRSPSCSPSSPQELAHPYSEDSSPLSHAQESDPIAPQDALPQADHNNPDQIQPWQNQLGRTSPVPDHSSLERANSAAARLDSLARLNGVQIPDSSSRVANLDVLPPFLMAKHIEETRKRVELGQAIMDHTLLSHSMPLANYPLPLPASLGFSVGPNGRGVPRLSALQRKALEKIANQQGSSDLPAVTTSLTRSHTTTGAESPKPLANRIHPSTTAESHERLQARSNLIRKLSSRGAQTRPRLPIQSPPPIQSLGSPQETSSEPLRFTPELTPSLEPPSVQSLSSQDPPAPTEHSSFHLPASPTSAEQSFDLNQLEISQLGSIPNFCLDTVPKPEHESMSESKPMHNVDGATDGQIDASHMAFNSPYQCAPHELRSSLDSLDSHPHSDQPVLAAPKNVNVGTSTPSQTLTTSPPFPVSHTAIQPLDYPPQATINTNSSVLPDPDLPHSERERKASQILSNLHLPDCQPTPDTSLVDLSRANAETRLSTSHHANQCADRSADPSTANGITTQPLESSPGPSARSSIASRIKARASLSSRIDRSLASGRPISPNQHSPQSYYSITSETKADRRRSANSQNSRVSRPSQLSTLQRFRNAPHENSEDHARKSTVGVNRAGATSSSKPFHYGDRPLRPTRAPPITEAHNVVGRGLAQHRSGGDLGPSQFPPTSNLVRTHMPAASAVDLARYNDHKLAPFPGLLNMTPPSSPERPRSPRSNSKTPKSANHGILSSASNFFRSPTGRSREESVTSEPRAMHPGLSNDTETQPPSKYSMQMAHSNDEEEEVVDSSRWQSMGDVAEKMSSPILTSRSSACDSHHYSSVSMISNQRREQILARLSPFLKPPAHSTLPNLKSHDPPRKLIWQQPVLQVANSASFKDRYLFVFNDILVVTKPLLEFEERDGERVPKLPITLQQSFLTKSVVELKDLRFMSTSPHENPLPYQVDIGFREAFERDPSQAIQSYLNGVDVNDKEADVAKLLLSTHDLDKRQLGQYLCGPEHTRILRSYLEQLNFAYMRLEDALRAVLLSLRLPADPDAITRFLDQFGIAWTTCNPKVCLTATLATRWATAMIVLSEHLHDGLTDSMRYVAGLIGLPNKLKTEAEFVDMIKVASDSLHGNSSTALPADKLDAMLKKAYLSIRRDRLVQARANAEDTEKVQLIVEEEGGAKGLQLPHHLTYQVPSELITVSIPQSDPHFGIKLFGPGLTFEPSFLSFSHSQFAHFRIKGKAIGTRQISFVKVGRRAAAYEGLPLNAMVSVERAFMRHTVQVGFYNHLLVKRKYLLSFHGPEPKAKFVELVTHAQNEARLKSSPAQTQNGPHAMSQMVALQVLRDTLILNEDLLPMNVNPYASTTVVLTSGKRKPKSGQDQNQNPEGRRINKIRSNSLSEMYIYTMGKNEKDLHQAIIDRRNQAQEMHVRNQQKRLLKEQLKTNLEGGKMALNPYSCSNKENPVGGADENQNHFLISKFSKTGLHLIQHCEQNSLIPLVLGFLSLGAVEKAGPKPPSGDPRFNGYPSLGHPRGGQNREEGRADEHDNKTLKKQTSHADNGLLFHQSSHPNPPSSSSVFNFAKLVSKKF